MASELSFDQQAEELYRKVLLYLDRFYIPGTLRFVRISQPGLQKEIDRVDASLETVWRQGLEGNATIREFKAVLYEWFSVHHQAVNVFCEFLINCLQRKAGGKCADAEG